MWFPARPGGLFVAFIVVLPGLLAALPAAAATPFAPTPVSPGSPSDPGDKVDSLTPTLRWEAVAGATNYHVAIRKAPWDTGPIVFEKGYVEGTSIQVPPGLLEPQTSYRWNVRAFNEDGPSEWSIRLYFQTQAAAALADFVITDLTLDQAVVGAPSRIACTYLNKGTGDAHAGYDVRIGVNDDVATVEPQGPALATGSSTTVTRSVTVSSGGPHTLSCHVNANRVVPETNHADSSWSTTITWTASGPPTRPEGLTPGSWSEETAELLASSTPTLHWKPVPGALRYHVCIRSGPTTREELIESTTAAGHSDYYRSCLEGGPEASFAVPPGTLATDTVYRWSVIAWNDNGPSGRASDVHVRTPAVELVDPGQACAHKSTPRKDGVAVDSIVIHAFLLRRDGPPPSFEAVAEDLRCGAGASSTHYVVSQRGEVRAIVPETRRAHHATYYNSRSIGIEIEGIANEVSWWEWEDHEAMYAALAHLIRDIRTRHPSIPLAHPTDVAARWMEAGEGNPGTHPYAKDHTVCAREPVARDPLACAHFEQPLDSPGIVAHAQVQPVDKQDPGPSFPWDRVMDFLREGGRSEAASPVEAAATGVSAFPCGDEATLRSRQGSTATRVDFVNHRNGSVQVLWLDYQGNRVRYSTLPPGHRLTQATYASHPWILLDETGSCLALVVATPERGTVVVAERLDAKETAEAPATGSDGHTRSPKPVLTVDTLATSDKGAVFVAKWHFPTAGELGIEPAGPESLSITYTLDARIDPEPGQHVVRAVAIDPLEGSLLKDAVVDLAALGACAGVGGAVSHFLGAACDLAVLVSEVAGDFNDANEQAQAPGVPDASGVTLRNLPARDGQDVALLVWMEREGEEETPWRVAIETATTHAYHPPYFAPQESGSESHGGVLPPGRTEHVLLEEGSHGAAEPRETSTDRPDIPMVTVTNVASSRHHTFLRLNWRFPTGAGAIHDGADTYRLREAALVVEGGGRIRMAFPLSAKPDDPWMYREAAIKAGASTGCFVIGALGSPVAGAACGVIVIAGKAAWEAREASQSEEAANARVERGILLSDAPFGETPGGSQFSYFVWIGHDDLDPGSGPLGLAIDTTYASPPPEAGGDRPEGRHIAVFSLEGDAVQFQRMRTWGAPTPAERTSTPPGTDGSEGDAERREAAGFPPGAALAAVGAVLAWRRNARRRNAPSADPPAGFILRTSQ